ncbi:MAG: CoA pyrophosphatase [Chloroflexota bacterium]
MDQQTESVMNIAFTTFIHNLQQDLFKELPGRDAQYRMAPTPRGKSWKGSYDDPDPTARLGGVLVLFYPYTVQLDHPESPYLEPYAEPYIPLILRQTYDGVHSGQIGLPGGGHEEQDESQIATALREAQEEIGVHADQIQVLGELSPLFIYASNFLVQPVVGWIKERPTFQAEVREVAQIIETPLSALSDPANYRCEEWKLRDRIATVPHFHIQGHNIWGATAMMLSELLALPSIMALTATQP